VNPASAAEFFGPGMSARLMQVAIVLGTALLILLLGIWLARWLAGLVRKAVQRRAGDVALASFIGNTAFVLMCAIVVIGALDRAGVPTASLLAALGAAGLAVGLALKDSLGNLAAGVLLVVSRPFRAGDVVEVAGRQGAVERIDLMHTVLAMPDNSIVSVPNGAIMTAPIVNFTARPTRRLELLFQVGFDDDPQRAVALIDEIVRSHPRVLGEPAPVVLLQRLAEGGYEIVARPWVRSGEVPVATGELLAAVGHALTAQGFHVPQRVIRLVPTPAEGSNVAAAAVRHESGR
jgi:small conductance mechanosensitive channel